MTRRQTIKNNFPDELYGNVISNQFSNILAAELLSISSTLKFLNTLTGSPVTDAANMIDVSGNAHDGTYKGTWLTTQRKNKGFGWMLSPNGTDNYINLGDSDDFSFGDGANDIAFTIAGVIEVANTITTRRVISKWDITTGAEAREWVLSIAADEALYMELQDESANVGVYRNTNSPLSAGFHTYVITYSGVGGATAANGIIMYIDGAVVASTAGNNAAYIAMENLTTPVWVGAYENAAGVPSDFVSEDFTPPVVDKGTVWTAAQVNRFHQLMKGYFNL